MGDSETAPSERGIDDSLVQYTDTSAGSIFNGSNSPLEGSDTFMTANNGSAYTQTDSTFIFYFYICIAVLGISLNGTVAGVILYNKRMRIVPNMFILNLAISDLLFCVGMPLIVHSTTVHKWQLGVFLCKIANGIDALNQFTGIFTIVMMSIERYMAIVHCMRAVNFRMRTMKGCLTNIGLVWFVATVITQPAWFTANVETINGKTMCHLAMGEFGFLWGVGSFLLGYLLPLATITVCYTLIFWDLNKTAANAGNSNVDRTTTKLVKIVLAIIVAFVISWTPFYFSVFFIDGLDLSKEVKQRIFEFSVGAIYIHPCINPLIFMCSSEQFRKHICGLFRKMSLRNRNGGEALNATGLATCTDFMTMESKRRPADETNLEMPPANPLKKSNSAQSEC